MSRLLYNSFINSKDMGRMVDAGGPVLHCFEDDCSGPPIVFLHGLGFSLFTFRKQYPFFSGSARIIATDLPGCGYSWLPGNYACTNERMAAYLKAFLDKMGVARAVLCGAGEGGMYALELALRYPEMVSALVLISPGSLTRYFPKDVFKLLSPLFGDIRADMMRYEHMRQFVHWCWFDENNVDSYIVRQAWKPFESRMARHVLLRILREYDDSYVHEHLMHVHCPTLVVWGEQDAGRPSGMAEIFTTNILGAQARIIRNCGMLPHEEKPKEFNDAMAAFLRGALVDFAAADETETEKPDGQDN